jgi:hypothetical protein
MAVLLPLTVELEDGTAWEVTADQRDGAKWEMQPFCADDRPTVRLRFLAFAASARMGRTSLSWPKFDAVCIAVSVTDREAEPVDPTPADPSAEA